MLVVNNMSAVVVHALVIVFAPAVLALSCALVFGMMIAAMRALKQLLALGKACYSSMVSAYSDWRNQSVVVRSAKSDCVAQRGCEWKAVRGGVKPDGGSVSRPGTQHSTDAGLVKASC